MMNQLLKKMKLKRFKDIFLVDTENIGYKIPDNIPKTTLIYLFISDPAVICKFQDLNNKQVKIVNLYSLLHKQAIKNGMDFCIVTQLKELVDISSSHHHIIIASKDKGYDCAIHFIKKESLSCQIERYPLSIEHYYHIQNAFKNILNHIDLDIKSVIFKHSCMETLKRDLSKKQRKQLIIYYYKDSICGNTVYIEYDVYKNKYILYYSGNIKSSYDNKENAYQAFLEMSQEMKTKFEKYETKAQYKKANELKINSFIEEAFLKHQSLLGCLIQHFGIKEGMSLYSNFYN